MNSVPDIKDTNSHDAQQKLAVKTRLMDHEILHAANRYSTGMTMSDRSFFIYRGWESAETDFVSQAMSQLTKHHVDRFSLDETQHYAWSEELKILDTVANRHPYCTIALEYMIPRMGKRVDAIVLIDKHIFVVEFKVGEDTYPAEAQDQVADYTFDLRNFHGDSHNRSLFPVLVCTDAPARNNLELVPEDGIYPIQLANAQNLTEIIDDCLAIPLPADPVLNHNAWLAAPYQPTPTIIEAAQALYQNNTVEDISRSEAGATNIAATTDCINDIIDYSRKNSRKSICFITGVPGAGKTLVGLNLASMRRTKDDEINDETAVFLSGNGPLITVLQASLAEDQQAHYQDECRACKSSGQPQECKGCPCKKTKSQIFAEVKTFVQGVHLFREELFLSNHDAPAEHIAIFDEAQRAWTADYLGYKMRTRRQNKRDGIAKSEPECLIEYMDRHKDWACMVCLVGGGQEINQGEAGIIEWFKSLRDHFTHWDVYAPDSIQGENYLDDVDLYEICPNINIVNDLHLSVDMRSFRNKNVAAFAEALVSNRPSEAHDLYESIENDYPIYVTRNLNAAKEWVRTATKRPSDRYGIVADSYGQRIRADGVIVPLEFDAVKWFLRGKDEVDSSYFMEIAASEFKIQGLEIDYAIVAWEGDYRYTNGNFEYHRFVGGKWQNVNAEMKRRYLKNGYRVLLTRARQGYVIYVPEGSDIDPTRPPSYYDETYEYLLTAGIRELETA